MNKIELEQEIIKLYDELDKLKDENAELKKNLHEQTSKNSSLEFQIEELENEVAEHYLDFDNPHGSAEKISDLGRGVRIEKVVALVNHLSTLVHENLMTKINNQRESLILNQRSLDSLSSCALSTSKQ